MLKFNLKKCFFFVACALHSCQQYSVMNQVHKGDTEMNAIPEVSDNNKMAVSSEYNPVWVVPCHGWTMNNDKCNELATLINALENKFTKDDLVVFMPTCRQDGLSNQLSIDEQACLVAEEVKKEIEKTLRGKYTKLSDEGIKKLRKKVQVVLIGNSQGGNVVLMIGSHITRPVDRELNIKAVISINAPLLGIKPLDDGCFEALRNMRALRQMLNQGGSRSWIKDGAQNFVMPILAKGKVPFVKMKGLQGMRQNSEETKPIIDFIYNNASNNIPNIPILLLGATVDSVSKYDRNNNIRQPEEFDKKYSNILTGDKNGKNDGLISLDSQLCRIPDGKGGYKAYPSNVETYVVTDNCFHAPAFFLLPNSLDFDAQGDTIAAENDKAIDKVEKCIIQKCNLKRSLIKSFD